MKALSLGLLLLSTTSLFSMQRNVSLIETVKKVFSRMSPVVFVREGNSTIIKRDDRYVGTLRPGINVKIPFIDIVVRSGSSFNPQAEKINNLYHDYLRLIKESEKLKSDEDKEEILSKYQDLFLEAEFEGMNGEYSGIEPANSIENMESRLNEKGRRALKAAVEKLSDSQEWYPKD